MIARLARLAAFQNPEFYRAQAMRLTTYGKPRIICCASLEPKYLVLLRGCLDETVELLESNKIHADLEDLREQGAEVRVRFLGTLREEQRCAVEALRAHDFGVLAATTAFGKTVVAAALIAERGCSTSILVHRRELLGQWVQRLGQFLSLEKDDLGVIGGGKRKPSGRIDVAVILSLVRKGEVSDLVAGYRQLIVDVLAALEAGRYPLVLTERRDHLEALRIRFEKVASNVVVLRGGMGSRERQAAEEVLLMSALFEELAVRAFMRIPCAYLIGVSKCELPITSVPRSVR